MRPALKYGLIFAASLVWVVFMGVQLHAVVKWSRRLQQAQQTHSDQTFQLQQGSHRIIQLAHDIRMQTDDMTFVQTLINVVPQEKGFLRTQRAMSEEVDALRDKVGRRLRNSLHVLVDTRANKLYVKKGLVLVWEADCSVGRGGTLTDKITGRRWEFVTPRGQFEVRNKMEKPLWIKPDWAFVEAGEEVPPPDDARRKVEGELGGYVLNLGDGYLIHGTRSEALLGRPVSHGCVRLAAADLQRIYEEVPRGTKVYIY